MNKTDVENLAEEFLRKAMGFLEQGQEIRPVLLNVKGGELTTVLLSMRNEADKVFLETAIPRVIRTLAPEASFMVTDAYLKDITNTHRIGEVVTVVAASPYGLISKAVKYTQGDGDKPIFGDIMTAEQTQSRFFHGVFPTTH